MPGTGHRELALRFPNVHHFQGAAPLSYPRGYEHGEKNTSLTSSATQASWLLPFCLGRQIHFTVNSSKTTLGHRSVPSFPVPLSKPLMDSKVRKKGPLKYLLV